MFKRKYAKMLLEQMNMIFDQWNSQKEITEKEMYSFLHRIKGTAGTIGLFELSAIASDLLDDISQEGVKLWQPEEWKFYLDSLIRQLELERERTESKREESKLSNENADQSEMLDSPISSRSTGRQIEQFGSSIVLIIDANLEFASELKERLEERNYVALIALTMEKGMDMFYRVRPAFIVSEFDLAMAIGDKELKQFVSSVRKSVTPITFIGKPAGNDIKIKSYELGASGYFAKPFDMELFTAYLDNRLSWRDDIQKITTIDELTGAFNRKYMNSILSQLMENYRQQQRIFSLVIMDLDHFKQVNDQYGHLTGDEVLKRVVSVCRSFLNERDEIFRFGGEEFIISLAETGQEQAMQLVEKMRVAFEKEVFISEEQQLEFQVTFSAGIAVPESQTETKDELLGRADQALYWSKSQGRNRVTFYSEEAKAKETRTLHMIIIDDDKFVRTILKRGFSTWKHQDQIDVEVHVHADGEEFLKSDWYHPQDQYVILLDGMMPKMDGIEVLTAIRENYPDKNIVVSMLSARSDEKNIILALEKGADDYLFKPFNVLEVIARIDRLAQRMLL